MPTTIRSRRVHEESHGLADAPRVLFVDDDGDVLETYRARLRKYRVNMLAAESGREGLRIAREDRPDLVVTDVCMSRGDGDYLVNKLKKRAHTARIPVIVISGVDDPDLALRMYRSGANRFLRKPVPFEQLMGEIGRYVEIERRTTLLTPFEAPAPPFTGSGNTGRRYRIDGAHGVRSRKAIA